MKSKNKKSITVLDDPSCSAPILDAANCSPVLCYVDGSWAYFTTQKLSEQWGDDWNDAPYEHNAGEPYQWHDRRDSEPWQIIKVAWDGEFEAPCAAQYNSPWSVQRINAGAVAWLQTSRWIGGDPIVIMAGTTIEDFCQKIREGGGRVYLEKD